MSIPLRIAVVQFSPKIGQVVANLNRAREICKNIQPRSVDLVCLPEMIFSGYVFPDAASISPYLEHPKTGPTSLFCADLAKRLECYVIAGYPERLSIQEGLSENQVGANSAIMYGPKGHYTGQYRKTNLFETDSTWAKPGTGFTTFELPSPLRTVSLGICMDLNVQPPSHWTIQHGPYELADYAAERGSNILVLLNAWLDSEEDDSSDEPDESDWSTLNFWASRLIPLWGKSDPEQGYIRTRPSSSSKTEGGHETIVVICNRSGEENGKKFAGTSALFSMKRHSGHPGLLDMMRRTEEGVRIWNIVV